jgi:hypothetical protein
LLPEQEQVRMTHWLRLGQQMTNDEVHCLHHGPRPAREIMGHLAKLVATRCTTDDARQTRERKSLVLPQSRAPSFCRGRLHDLTSCRTAWSVHNPMSLKMRLTLLSSRCCRVYAVGRSVNCLYGGSMTPLSWCRVPYGSLVQLPLVRLQGGSSVTAGVQ